METNLSSNLWAVANLLRGDYKQSDYGKVILPFTLLRRLDSVLADTKAAVLEMKAKVAKDSEKVQETQLKKAAKQTFFNTSQFALGNIRDMVTDAVIEHRSASNTMAGQILSDDGKLKAFIDIMVDMAWYGFEERRKAG